ncbi:MAG: SpoIIE family protein phosphatase [Spirochaetota bacterium]
MKKRHTGLTRLLALLDERIRTPQFIRKRIEKYSVASKINFIILVAVLPMLFILSLIFLVLFFQISGQIESTLLQKMVAAKNAYNFYERSTLVYAQMLSENAAIKKELLADTVNVGPILRICRQAQAGTLLNRITIYDRKGIVIVRSHNPSEFGDDRSGENFVAKALKEGQSSPALVHENGKLVLQNTVPIQFDDDRIGAVTAGYELDHPFARTLSDLTQSGIFVVHAGQLIAASFAPDTASVTQTGYESQNQDYSVSRRVTYTDRLNKQRNENMDFRFIPIATPAGSPDLRSPGLAIALKPSYPRFLLYTLFWGGFVLILLVIFLGILLSFKIGHKIANYASSLSEAMENFTKGDHDVRVSGASDDELGKVARAFNHLAEELQRRIRYIHDTNESLAALIAERTQDLGEALNRVTRLEEMQQGDYLLMSQLLTPLGASDISLGKLQASFFAEQKKHYSFKGQSGQIGGDYTLFAPLRFRGSRSPWLFFFSGDAMGKSSQGAAGALVCGVTLQSILARTVGTNPLAAKPEVWLKSVFRELDHIFSMFKGSMSMTAVLGLVNSQTGKAFYLNAEHPPLLLYRKGKARYLDDKNRLRKLGGASAVTALRPQALTLHPGDTLLAGSDGKDDLEIAGSIDSAEERFLKVAEKARGDLKKIDAALRAAGRYSDDVSMVRIAVT